MSKYVKSFTPFYEGGWENQPSENTPIMGEALDAYDSTFVKIEEYLESYEPDIPQGEIPTKVSELENDAGYLTEETVKDVEFPNLVPASRTIAGIDLADDISVEEMQEALDIYDSTIMDGEIKPWLYSEEETISGTYRGKPLYKKVLEPIIITEDMKKYSIEDIPYEYISIDQSMSFVLRNDASFPITNIGYDANSDTVAGGITQHAYITPDKSITFRKGNGITSYTAYITLQYTKTTDTEGSGSDLNPYGIYNAKLDGVKEDIEDVKNSIIETIDTTLENSNAGRLLFTEIKGVMEQGENPSPTNPQEIKNSVVSGIKTHRKNFWNGTISLLSFIYLKPIKAGETFTVSYDYAGQANVDGYGLYIFDEIGSYGSADIGGEHYLQTSGLAYATPSDRNFSTITANADGYLYFRQVTPSNYAYLSNFQVEEGTGTEFEPYTESSITFSQPIELYGLDDVRDILTSKQIKRKFGVATENNFTLASSNSVSGGGLRWFDFKTNSLENGNGCCTHLKSSPYAWSSTTPCFVISGGRIRVYDNSNTNDEFKAKYAGMKFVYQHATPTEEDLPIADQIALNSLLTFYGITHVEFISEIKPTFIAKYGTTEMGGMTLESLLTARSNDLRLSAVESAVINNI